MNTSTECIDASKKVLLIELLDEFKTKIKPRHIATQTYNILFKGFRLGEKKDVKVFDLIKNPREEYKKWKGVGNVKLQLLEDYIQTKGFYFKGQNDYGEAK